MTAPLVAPLVARVRDARRNAPEQVELELRLGSDGPGGFVAGVDAGTFAQIDADLASMTSLRAGCWVETVDYHYVVQKGQQVRTRVCVDPETLLLSTSHITKQALARLGCTVDLASTDEEEEEGEDPPFHCRMSLSRELPVAPPPVTVPTHVRIKQRKVYQDVRGGGVVWSYELTRTWSANSRRTAEYRQKHEPPVYEVEIELVDELGAYLCERSDAEVAASLCRKAGLLLGVDETVPLRWVEG